MRYELIPKVGEFVSIYNDIPNNAYVYSNELSSSQVALFKKEYDQFIRLNMSNKMNTANTRLGMFFNSHPNDEIYMVCYTHVSMTFYCVFEVFHVCIS